MVKKIQGYSLLQNIGRGSSGDVYRAIHVNKQGEYAIKVIQNQLLIQNPKTYQCLLNEINALSKIGCCQNIVSFYEVIKSKNCHYFVYEYCNGGNLQEKLKRLKNIKESQALEYIKNILSAYKILNKYKVMHRDLKPQNILFHNGVLKLADFGYCKGFQSEQYMTRTMLGSPIYMAPEILKGESYSAKADIWSLGIILYEMLYGNCPYHSNSIASLASKIETSPLQLPQFPKISQQTKKVLKKMLIKDQFKRIGWIQLFNEYLPNNQYKYFSLKNIGINQNNNTKQKKIQNNLNKIQFHQKASLIHQLQQNNNNGIQKQNQIKFNSNKYLLYLNKSQSDNWGNNQSSLFNKNSTQLNVITNNNNNNISCHNTFKTIHNNNNNNTNILGNYQNNKLNKSPQPTKHTHGTYHSSKKLPNSQSLQHISPKPSHNHQPSIDFLLTLQNKKKQQNIKIQNDKNKRQIKQLIIKLQKIHQQFIKITPNCEHILRTTNKQHIIDMIQYLKNIRDKLYQFIKKFNRIKKQHDNNHNDIQVMIKYEIIQIQQIITSISTLIGEKQTKNKQKQIKKNEKQNIIKQNKFQFKNFYINRANDKINQICL